MIKKLVGLEFGTFKGYPRDIMQPNLNSKIVLPIPEAILQCLRGEQVRDRLNEIGHFRLKVWQATGTKILIPPDTAQLLDVDLDLKGTHFLITQNSVLLAATRLDFFNDFSSIPGIEFFSQISHTPIGPTTRITRTVVDPVYQRLGIGKILDRLCINESERLGYKSIVCDVPPYRIETLKNMGFHLIHAPKLGRTFSEIEWNLMCRDTNG